MIRKKRIKKRRTPVPTSSTPLSPVAGDKAIPAQAKMEEIPDCSPTPSDAGSDPSALPSETPVIHPSLPPKVVQSKVIHVAGQALQQHGGGLMTADGRPALPVLDAFHEFLDIERERTRKRIILVFLSFLSVFAVFIVGVLSFGYINYERTHREMASITQRLADTEQSAQQIREHVLDSLVAISSDAKILQDQLGKQEDLFSSTQTGLNEQIEGTSRNLGALRQMMMDLKRTNATIRLKLMQTQNLVCGLSNRVNRFGMPAVLPLLSRPTDPKNRIDVTEQQPVVTTVAKSNKSLSIQLRPSGPETPFAWRLPIP